MERAMRISNPRTLAHPETRKQVNQALANGDTVTIEPAEPHEARTMASESGEHVQRYVSEHGEKPVAKVDSDFRQNLEHAINEAGLSFTPKEKAAMGIASGTILGTGVGLLMSLGHAAAAEPTGIARAVTTAAWALIGTGSAGLLVTGTVGRIDVLGLGSLSAPGSAAH
jgi:hypothetical protein